MKAQALYARWRRCFARYERDIHRLADECSRSGEVEAVHRLRVALRRARLLAAFGSFILGEERVWAFRQWTKPLLDAFGRVRDLDITLAWLEGQPTAPSVLQAIRDRRHELLQEATPTGRQLAESGCSVLRGTRANASQRKRLKKRYTRQLQRAAALGAYAEGFLSLSTEQTHDLRRTVRRLRYLREVALRPSEQKADAALKALLRFQTAMGDAQDRAVIGSVLASFLPPETKHLRKVAVQEQQEFLKRAQPLLAKLAKVSM